MNKLILFAVGAAILAGLTTSPAFAAPAHKVGMTCEEFLSLDKVSQPKVI